MSTKYKVWVIADSSGHWATNGLEFDSMDDANDWGIGLLMRWTAAKDYQVCQLSDDPNKERISAGLTTSDALQRSR